MKLRQATLAALLVFATACGAFTDDGRTSEPPTTSADATPTAQSETPTTDTTPSPTTLPDTTTSPALVRPVEITLTECTEDSEFDILCEAYDLLIDEYVDPLDDSTLAAGAARGIAEFLDASAGDSGISTVACPLPADAFEQTCQVAAEALGSFVTTPLSVAEAAVFGLFEYGIDDPNSQYLTPEALTRLTEEQSGTISGIGSLVNTEEEDGAGGLARCSIISATCEMAIVSVIEGGPADLAGLRSGDVMVSVYGTSVIGLTTEDVVSRVRGPEGESVTIEISREGTVIEFTIVRAPIEVPVTETQLFEDGVGYVKLSQFTNNSGPLFRDAIEDVLDAGATRLIVDFQNNPGGALNAAISVASEFLDEGLVLRTQSPDEERPYSVTAGGAAVDPDIEIVVLVNRGSASASEVVAGVLQEAERATIIGEPTFGKNTVQQRYSLSNGGAVKVTIARWVTPGGNDFGVEGIVPDVQVEFPDIPDADALLDEALAYYGVSR